MGEGGREHIRQNFLLPSMLHAGKITSLPMSRIDKLSYPEIQDHIGAPKRGWLASSVESKAVHDGATSKISYFVMAHQNVGSPQFLRALSEIHANEPEAEFVLVIPEIGRRRKAMAQRFWRPSTNVVRQLFARWKSPESGSNGSRSATASPSRLWSMSSKVTPRDLRGRHFRCFRRVCRRGWIAGSSIEPRVLAHQSCMSFR